MLVGCEHNPGDGAGILMQMPDSFLRKGACGPLGIELPNRADTVWPWSFTSPEATERNSARHILERILHEEQLQIIGWRDVPTDNSSLGNTAKAGEPLVRRSSWPAGRKPLMKGGLQPQTVYRPTRRAIHEIRDRKWITTGRSPVSPPAPSSIKGC